jgi:hypothetical protein
MTEELTEKESKQIDLTLELLLTYANRYYIMSDMTFVAFENNGITNQKRVEFICEKLNILGVFELKNENIRSEIHFFKDKITVFLTKGGMTDIWLERENKRANIKLINKTLSEFCVIKWIARLSFFIVIILAILQIIQRIDK